MKNILGYWYWVGFHIGLEGSELQLPPLSEPGANSYSKGYEDGKTQANQIREICEKFEMVPTPQSSFSLMKQAWDAFYDSERIKESEDWVI